MIANDEDLQQALEALGHLYRALAALRAEVLPRNAEWFALMAEGPRDQIREIQQQIDAYTGLSALADGRPEAERQPMQAAPGT